MSNQLACADCLHQRQFSLLLSACPNCGSTAVKINYNLADLKSSNWRQQLSLRASCLWRYRELLPILDVSNIVSLGEGFTPLIHAKKLGEQLGLPNLYIKDERQGPTGSFKDRQASVAVSVLKEQGITEIVLASTGNVALSYAAYAAKADLKLWTFVVDAIPEEKLREISLYGGEVIRVRGTYDQTKVVAEKFAKKHGKFLDRGIKNIAAVESMKTLAYEISEQLGWRSPDWYIQSVSGGLGPAGVTKGFEELLKLELINKVPAIGIIQPSGCAPMVKAFKSGADHATAILNPQTKIMPLATGDPGKTYEFLKDLIEKYGGAMEDATDEAAFAATHLLARTEGISAEPAATLTFAGLINLAKRGIVKPHELIVVNCCGHTYPVEKEILGEMPITTLEATQAY